MPFIYGTADTDRIAQAFDTHLNRQFPFAAKTAINNVAAKVIAAEQREMRDVFDRPTPWTLSSMRVIQFATAASLSARVGFKDGAFKGSNAGDYLQPQVVGGARPAKRFESLLYMRGLLPSGDFLIPSSATALDAYGNVPRGVYSKVAAQLQASREKHNNQTATSRKRKRGKAVPQAEYFVGKPAGGRLPMGVWSRFPFGHGSAIKPVFTFSSWTSYRELFPFFDVAEMTVNDEMPTAFASAMQVALATAR
jgi:hypothetical protein